MASKPKKEPTTKEILGSIRDEEIAIALRKTKGILSFAATHLEQAFPDRFGGIAIPRTFIEGRIKRSDMLKAVRDEAKENVKDRAEDVIFLRMNSSDENVSLRAATWYLERQAKDRGYTTRLEVTDKDGRSLSEGRDLAEFPAAARKSIRAALDEADRLAAEAKKTRKEKPKAES